MTRALAFTLAFAAALPVLAQAPAGPFDPSRDAMKDFEAAKAEAKKSGKRILLDVGGNWCSWCRLLDRFYTDPSVVPEVFLLHRELAAAIGDGREWKAAEVMRSILEYGEKNLRRILGAEKQR